MNILSPQSKAIQLYKDVEARRGCLDLAARMTIEDAEEFGKYILLPIYGSIQLWWGDFLNECEDRFGEEYAQIVPEEIATPTYLKWKWVCRKIPKSIRRRMKHLEFSHYEVLSGLDDEAEILRLCELAEEKGMSKRDLKALVSPEPPPSKTEITCPKCGYKFEK